MPSKTKIAEATITTSSVRELLAYDASTGVLTWLVSRGGLAKAGREAGWRCPLGYRAVTLLGTVHKAHRLIWLHVHGNWPSGQIDHINGVRDDNRITNLRECTRSENYQNKAVYRNNTSGFTGVTWHPPNKAWVARIGVNGRKHCLGYHPTPEAAHSAYLEAKATFHQFQPIPRGSAL